MVPLTDASNLNPSSALELEPDDSCRCAGEDLAFCRNQVPSHEEWLVENQ